MSMLFSEILRRLRTEKGLSQRELAERMYVTRSTVARWENGSRMPDAMMVARLSECLEVDVHTLLRSAAESDENPNVILVDDRKIILTGGLPVLEEVMPQATVTGSPGPRRPLNTPGGTGWRWPLWTSKWERSAGWSCAPRC